MYSKGVLMVKCGIAVTYWSFGSKKKEHHREATRVGITTVSSSVLEYNLGEI
jgi:hypothetical protein